MEFDEQPVGQHKAMEIPELLPEEEKGEGPERKGKLEERIVSKNPKTRFEAFSELVQRFSEGEPGVFETHYPRFQKYISDAHPGSQEKALEAFLILLSRSPPRPDKQLSDILEAIFEKGCSSAKTATKNKAFECLVAIAELEDAQTLVCEPILEYLSAKGTAPKVTIATLQAVTHLLTTFGNKVFPIRPALPHVVTQATSTNAGIKTEAMNYLKEAHRWAKDDVLPAVEKLKPVQQEEFKKSIVDERLPAVPLKLLKGAMPAVVAAERMSDVSPAKEEKKDTYLEAKEVSVLKKFNDAWCNTVLGIKKWSEKRDKLEELYTAISVEKLRNDPHYELTQTLKKLLNDSNVVVVNTTIKIIGQMARSLRSNFASEAKHFFSPMVLKCRDRKTITEALKSLEYFVHSVRIEEIGDEIKEALGDRSPQVKVKMCSWLESVVQQNAGKPTARFLAGVVNPILIKLSDEAASDVRDAALSCLGVIKAIVNDPGLNKVIQEMNSQKQEKIAKSEEQVRSAAGGERRAVPMEEVKPGAVANSGGGAPPEAMKLEPVRAEAEAMKVEGSGLPHAAEEEKGATAAVHPSVPKKTVKKDPERKPKSKVKETKEEDVGELPGEEVMLKTIEEHVPKEVVEGLELAEWKERVRALQELNTHIQRLPEIATHISEAIGWWIKAKLKDFKESNPSIMKEALACLQSLAASHAVSKKFASIIVPGIIEKIGDVKLSVGVTSIIMGISDSATPSFTSKKIIQTMAESKNVNAIKNTFGLLSGILEEYGTKLAPLSATVEFSRQFYSHANPQIRMAAGRYLTLAYSWAGPIIKTLLSSDPKDTTLKALEPDFAKVAVKPPKEAGDVKRKLRGDCQLEAASKGKKDLADSLLPQASIASQITTRILSGLTDSSMKHRQEAKDAIEKILAVANNRIQATGLTALMVALKSRMNEPGKNLAKSFICLVGSLAQAMGVGCKQYAKIILQPLMYNLADKQKYIKQETIIAINKFAEAGGHDLIINCIGPLLEKDNPDLRIELIAWALENKEHIPKSDVGSLVPSIVLVLQDRSKEIVNMAEELVKEVMPLVGFHSFEVAIQDLKPIVKSSLQAILERCSSVGERGELMEDVKVEEAKPRPDAKIVVNSPAEETLPLDQIMTEPAMDEPSPSADPAEKRLNKVESPPTPSAKPSTPMRKKGDTKIIASNNSRKVREEVKKSRPPMMSRPITAASMRMTGSRSTNDLVLSEERGKTMGRMQSRKDMLEFQRKTPAKGIRGTMMKQSPSKSQLSSGSNTGCLYVEQAIINPVGGKERRTDKEIGKWPVNEVRDEYMEKLKKVLKPIVHPSVFEYMFSTQFKKNLEVVKVWTECVRNDFSAFTDIQDLIFKWLTTKMVDQSNPAMTKSILELLRVLFVELIQHKMEFVENESGSILPMLCERVSAGNATLREEMKSLIRQASDICSPKRVCTHLVQALDSKNPKTKFECLSLLKEFIEKTGLSVITTKDLKAVARLVGTGDAGIKGEAVSTLMAVYKSKRDRIWPYLGEVSEKNREMLEERFRTVEAEAMDVGDESVDEANEITHSMKKIKISSQDRALGDVGDTGDTGEEPRRQAEEEAKRQLVFAEPLPAARPSEPEVAPMEDVSFLTSTFDKFEESKRPMVEGARVDSAATPLKDKKYLIDSSNPMNLGQCLEVLKFGEVSKKVDALVCLNEKVTTFYEVNRAALCDKADQLVDTFTEVIINIFEKPTSEVPIRFAKYLINVVMKYCGIKAVMKEVSTVSMKGLMEQLLGKLLYEGIDKMGEHNEGECMINSLNTTMLRILENGDPTKVFISLIELFRKTKNVTQATGKENITKLPGLIIKCILKLIKVIDTLIPFLEVDKLLYCMHEYMVHNPTTSQSKNMNDEIGVRVIKTIINELVKAKREGIWEDYRAVEESPSGKSDNHIKRWIRVILKSLEVDSSAGPPALSVSSFLKDSPDELKEIFKGLNSQATFSEAIKSLGEYMERNPHFDINQYLACCSKAFGQIVLSALQKHSATARSEVVPVSPAQQTTPLTDSSKVSSLEEYKAKMAFLKQKLGMPAGDDKPKPLSDYRSAAGEVSSTEVFEKINKFKAMMHQVPKKP